LTASTELNPIVTLATSQKGLIATAILFGCACVGLCWHGDVCSWCWLWLLIPAATFGSTLAIEYCLLVRLDRSLGAEPPRFATLFQAWAGEISASSRVFLWRQPFRSGRWPDQLTGDSLGRTGVLLVHGFLCNRGIWNVWLERLTHAKVPFVAVSLQPILGSIDDYEREIEEKVRALELACGRPPVVVAHSMGGLAVRNWWARQDVARSDGAGTPRLAHLFTMGSPHRGTWLARFGFSTNARQMRQESSWIAELNAMEPASNRKRTTCFYSACDNVVFPREVATLEGAENLELLAVAHVAMVDHAVPLARVLKFLERCDNSAPK
jgi:triacylglycerol lipase